MTSLTASGPVLNPATRVLWRPDGTVQLELGDRAVVVADDAVAAVRSLADRAPRAPRVQPRPGAVRAALRVLIEAGFVWPAAADDDAEARVSPPRPPLAAELRALSARHGARAAELLAGRAHSSVVVRGDNRAGPLIAAILAASGVGHVHVPHARPVRLHQVLPGGAVPDDEGRAFTAAAAEAVRRAAPSAEVGPRPRHEPPDLIVLATDQPVDPDHRAMLHHDRQAHLAVRLGADHGVVGPLVVPGLTSCLRCADLHRSDRDESWPALSVQLSIAPPTGTPSSAALSTTVAGVAAGQALAYLDGDTPAAIDGTLEQHLPDWRLRRRSWPAHPGCDCTASRRRAGARDAE